MNPSDNEALQASPHEERMNTYYVAIFGTVVFIAFGLIFMSYELYNQDKVVQKPSLDAALSLSTRASEQAKSALEDVPSNLAPEETDQIIVKYNDSVSSIKRSSIERTEKLKEKSTIRGINAVVYTVDATDTGREVAERMKINRKGDIEFVEVDMKVAPSYIPNDQSFLNQWHVTRIEGTEAWSTAQGANIVIGVADTGVDCAHVDLAASCVSGWNVASSNGDTTDINGHGTAVAGTAAEVGDNVVGSAGIAYKAKIMPLRVTNDPTGYAYWSSIANAITWGADHGARVVTNSYGSSQSAAVQSAANYLRKKGGVFTAAAANDGAQLSGSNPGMVTTVSATDKSDLRASWSNYGSIIDVAAPGLGIYTTVRGNSYGLWSGTSLATPIVAGVYALIFSADPSLTPAQADNILYSSAEDFGTAGWDQDFGYGRVNAARAIALVSNVPGNTAQDTTAPSVPQNLILTITASAVTLSWSASTDTVGVSGYDLYRDGTKLTTVSGTTYTDSNLQGGTTYSYYVVARDAAGNVSGQSSTVFATTQAAPFSISGSAVTAKTGTTATIAATTNKVANVAVYYGLSATSLTLSTALSTGTTHSMSLTGLKPKTKYFYQVRATSATGETTQTAVSNFRTGAR